MFIAAYAQDGTRALYEAALATTDRQTASIADGYGCGHADGVPGAGETHTLPDGGTEVCGQWEQR